MGETSSPRTRARAGSRMRRRASASCSVSRRITASVEMHCSANTKNTQQRGDRRRRRRRARPVRGSTSARIARAQRRVVVVRRGVDLGAASRRSPRARRGSRAGRRRSSSRSRAARSRGSSAWPALPAALCSSVRRAASGGRRARRRRLRGNVQQHPEHDRARSRMIVPARRRNARALPHTWRATRLRGRACGTAAAPGRTAAPSPRSSVRSSSAADHERRDARRAGTARAARGPGGRAARRPRTAGTKAPISSAYTGSRAEQVISGATRIVTRRSRGDGIVRVAMIPGTAHA